MYLLTLIDHRYSTERPFTACVAFTTSQHQNRSEARSNSKRLNMGLKIQKIPATVTAFYLSVFLAKSGGRGKEDRKLE